MKVSIIISTKNNALTIREALEKIFNSLSELEEAYEILVVDAHSTGWN